MENSRFMIRTEILDFFAKREGSSAVGPRIINYLFVLKTPSRNYLYFRNYFNALIAFLGNKPADTTTVWSFLQSEQAKQLIATEKKDLQSKIDSLAKRKTGLNAETIAELFGLPTKRVEKWAAQGHITLLDSSQSKEGLYCPQKLLDNFEWLY